MKFTSGTRRVTKENFRYVPSAASRRLSYDDRFSVLDLGDGLEPPRDIDPEDAQIALAEQRADSVYFGGGTVGQGDVAAGFGAVAAAFAEAAYELAHHIRCRHLRAAAAQA